MEEKYYRVTAYISEKALRHNIRLIREKVGRDIWIMGVVKSNAYGHGVKNVVPILDEEGVDYFAVAIIEEGIELRELGTTRPILLLGYTDPSQYGRLLEYDLTATIFHEEDARLLSELALQRGKKARVHLKVETGMGRIGIPATETGVEEATRIAYMPGLEVEGAFTHYARSDEKDKSAVAAQYEKYMWFVDSLEERGIVFPIHHTANSAAIMECPKVSGPIASDQPHRRMVRAGIMLYGLYPSHEIEREGMDLWPVLSLRSHIIHIKEVEDGTPIGYGGTYIAKGKRKIATVPVGYGDGYPRRLSNQGWMVIDGQRAPIAGRVCMDQTMVDITEIENAYRGMPVTLIGDEFTAEEMADMIDTIHYEVVCQLSERVPKILDRE